MSWIMEMLNEDGNVVFSQGDASAMIVGAFTVIGKTASTVGNPDGNRSFTVPAVPANTGIFWVMQGINLGSSVYESSSWPISANTFGYRIDQAAVDAVTVIRYGYRAVL